MALQAKINEGKSLHRHGELAGAERCGPKSLSSYTKLTVRTISETKLLVVSWEEAFVHHACKHGGKALTPQRPIGLRDACQR